MNDEISKNNKNIEKMYKEHIIFEIIFMYICYYQNYCIKL